MASGKRASMREGPLAQLFRKTDDEEAGAEAPRSEAEPKAGRPLPEDGPAPQATRQVPEPRPERRAEPEEPAPAQDAFSTRATEAARRHAWQCLRHINLDESMKRRGAKRLRRAHIGRRDRLHHAVDRQKRERQLDVGHRHHRSKP